jgi:hypothetical protein
VACRDPYFTPVIHGQTPSACAGARNLQTPDAGTIQPVNTSLKEDVRVLIAGAMSASADRTDCYGFGLEQTTNRRLLPNTY